MAAHAWKIEVASPVTGPTNPALITFDFNTVGGASDAETAAGIFAYWKALCVASVIGPACYATGIFKRPSGAAGGFPVPFPVTEYAALVAANPGAIPASTVYNNTTGGGTAFEPIGTAITVSLYTVVPGRKTTGRHYLPWIATDVNDGNGHLVVTAPGQIEDAYDAFIQGNTNSNYTGLVNLAPAVQSATAGTTNILTPKVSTNYARLKTRTR